MRRAVVAMLVFAAPALAASEPARLPVPNDVIELPETYRVDVANTALDVQGYVTALPMEELVAFYRKALTSGGWRMEPLPWQSQHTHAMEHIEQATKDDPAVAQDPAVQARRTQLERTQASLARRLHGVHGQDHVIVQLLPYPVGKTAVFLNRWHGEAGWVTASGRGEACCSGAPIAHPGPLPMSIPQYPGSAVIAKSTASGGDTGTAALTSPDGVEAIEAYYRKHMAYNGWTLDEATAHGEGLRFLAFSNTARACGITLGPGHAPGAQTLITIEIMPRPPFPFREAGG